MDPSPWMGAENMPGIQNLQCSLKKKKKQMELRP